MAPEEESKPETAQPEVSEPRAAGRRDRRPSRGRRGRGRGRRPKPPQGETPGPAVDMVAPAEPEAVFELADEGTQASGQESPLAEVGESIPEPLAPQPDIPPGRPAAPVTVEQAIEEVGNIVESLRGSLEEMEEVMELLEMFERQKTADEREIESLRRALRQMHRPRDPGRHPHR